MVSKNWQGHSKKVHIYTAVMKEMGKGNKRKRLRGQVYFSLKSRASTETVFPVPFQSIVDIHLNPHYGYKMTWCWKCHVKWPHCHQVVDAIIWVYTLSKLFKIYTQTCSGSTCFRSTKEYWVSKQAQRINDMHCLECRIICMKLRALRWRKEPFAWIVEIDC